MDNNRERKTVRFDPELQVVFVEKENEPNRLPSISLEQSSIRHRVKEYQSDLVRRSRLQQQSRPPALPPRNHTTDVLALIHDILEKPIDTSPPSTPPAVTPSSLSSPPPLLPKPQPQPRAKHSLSVTSRGVQRYRRDLAIVDGLSGSVGLVAKREKATQSSRFFIPLSMHPHVPPMIPPSPTAQLQPQLSTSNAAAVEVVPTAIVPGQDTRGIPRATVCQRGRAGEGESEKRGDSSGMKHKGRCKKRNGRCKKCDRAANQPQDDGNDSDGGRSNNGQGCATECLLIAIQCMGCTIT